MILQTLPGNALIEQFRCSVDVDLSMCFLQMQIDYTLCSILPVNSQFCSSQHETTTCIESLQPRFCRVQGFDIDIALNNILAPHSS